MEFLAAVGFLTVCFLIFIAFSHHAFDADLWVQKNGRLIENSDKCQALIDKFNFDRSNGNREMTLTQLHRRLKRILSDPVELEKALDKIKRRDDFDLQRKQQDRDFRKVGFKYEIEIFEIFWTSPSLSKTDLLKRIKDRFSVNAIEALSLFELWTKNYLIQPIYEIEDMWKIGFILTMEGCKIDPTDLIYSEWLERNGLSLESE